MISILFGVRGNTNHQAIVNQIEEGILYSLYDQFIRGVVIKLQACEIILSDFELLSR